ncbi:MAG: hypothetical protein DMG96_39725 [Acidobacteria bacterium]|nr:MAG: hypothetical protein DMG96_39725 [Acidobacteriota bacterium]
MPSICLTANDADGSSADDNQSKSSITVTVNLSNLANPLSSVTPYRTSSTENQAPLSTIPVNGGSLTIRLPASSIVTLIG